MIDPVVPSEEGNVVGFAVELTMDDLLDAHDVFLAAAESLAGLANNLMALPEEDFANDVEAQRQDNIIAELAEVVLDLVARFDQLFVDPDGE